METLYVFNEVDGNYTSLLEMGFEPVEEEE